MPRQSGTTQCTGPITVAGPANTWTISAMAVKSQMIDSTTASASYSMSYPGLATLTFSPPPGTYDNGAEVMVTSNPGSTIWYTTDGSTPTTSSTQYTGTAVLITANGAYTTLKALATSPPMADSVVTSVTYALALAPSPPMVGTATSSTMGVTVPAIGGKYTCHRDTTYSFPNPTLVASGTWISVTDSGLSSSTTYYIIRAVPPLMVP